MGEWSCNPVHTYIRVNPISEQRNIGLLCETVSVSWWSFSAHLLPPSAVQHSCPMCNFSMGSHLNAFLVKSGYVGLGGNWHKGKWKQQNNGEKQEQQKSLRKIAHCYISMEESQKGWDGNHSIVTPSPGLRRWAMQKENLGNMLQGIPSMLPA